METANKMHKRGRSKTRTEYIDMEDKEATPVEEVEVIVRNAQGDQPEKPTQPAPEAEAIAGDTVENPPYRTIPVSYTHLDVYKRQGLGCKVKLYVFTYKKLSVPSPQYYSDI